MLAATVGTGLLPSFQDSILVLEDIDEPEGSTGSTACSPSFGHPARRPVSAPWSPGTSRTATRAPA